MYKHFFKRLLDIVLSAMAIIVLAIPMLVVAVMIKIDSPGPVLFKQKRIGLRKSTFTILKYRSMPVTVPHDTPTHLFNAESSLSRFQKTMRACSIDELPQLFNIFIGQMSIIGPRPALWNQYDLIAERDKYGANDVKPGLSGWAQVNGRDELSIEDKAQLDGVYAKNTSLKMDWICLITTVGKVLKHSGVIEGGTGVVAKQVEKQENALTGASSTGARKNEAER